MCGGRDRWTMDAILLTLPTAPSPVTTHCGLRTRVSSGGRRLRALSRAPWFGLAVSIPLLGLLGPTNLERLNCPGSSHDANMALLPMNQRSRLRRRNSKFSARLRNAWSEWRYKIGCSRRFGRGGWFRESRKTGGGRRDLGGSRQTAGNGGMCPCSKQPKADSSESASVSGGIDSNGGNRLCSFGVRSDTQLCGRSEKK